MANGQSSEGVQSRKCDEGVVARSKYKGLGTFVWHCSTPTALVRLHGTGGLQVSQRAGHGFNGSPPRRSGGKRVDGTSLRRERDRLAAGLGKYGLQCGPRARIVHRSDFR